MSHPTFLEGERVTLHPLEEDDLEFCHEAINRPEIRKRVLSTTPLRMADEEEWYESLDPEEPPFMIRADGERVGVIGINEVNDVWGTALIGYWIHPDHWGNGYCTDAVRCVARYAFDERRLAKLAADALVTNEGSRRVLEKAGFQHEATLRKEAFVDGERVDLTRYGLLAEEWRDGDA